MKYRNLDYFYFDLISENSKFVKFHVHLTTEFHFRNKELATSSILDCSSVGTLTNVSPNTINTNSGLKMEYNLLHEERPYIKRKKQDEVCDSLQSPTSIDAQCTNDMDAGYIQQLPNDRHGNDQQSSYNIHSVIENSAPLEQWEVDFILGESQLEQCEIDLILNESQVINVQESHSPLLHLSNVRGNECEFHIESLREYSSYDTTDNQSDVTVATYENQPTYDYEVAQESLDSGYMSFLAEFMENITQPWLDEPDINEI